jgi:hypothetical protein
MWTQKNKTIIGMLKEWKIGRILVRKKTRLLKRLVPLFFMSWETPMPNFMLEFVNTFLIKGTYIYFGHKDKVYVISKQLIIDVFGVCAEGYVEDLKGQVSKSLAV